MTPAEILPGLSPDDIEYLAYWLSKQPPSVAGTHLIYCQIQDLSHDLVKLANFRRQA